VGSLLLAANLACGAWKVDSWPFSVYPRFDGIRAHAMTIQVEAMLESEAGSRRLRLPLRQAMLMRLQRLPEGEERDRRLRTLTEYVLSRREPLAPGETVRIYATTYSTLPDDWQAAPLRRDLLFDYHAARDDEPCPDS
jgi:hypothetical protein